MLEKNDAVDVFIFSHSNSFHKDFETIPQNLRKKLRMIYNAGCYDSDDSEHYLKLGAGTYVAHLGASYSWLFVYAFADAWKRGHSAVNSVEIANQATTKHLRGLPGRILEQLDTEEKQKKAIAATRAIAFGNSKLSVHSRYKVSK